MSKELVSYMLQMFADGEDGGQTDSSNADDKGAGTENPGSKEQKPAGKDGKKDEDIRTKPKYSDEDVDRIIESKFERWQKKKEKEVEEAKKLADMNAQQRAEHERDKLQKELDELKTQNTRSQLAAEARKMLRSESINVSDELVSLLITGDAETTKASVDSFSKLFKDSVEEAVKEALKGGTPKGGANGGTTLTKEQIMDIKDPVERQQKMRENYNLYRK